MLRTKLLKQESYGNRNEIDEQINEFINQEKLTRRELIDIKYNVCESESFYYYSALLIYEN